MVITLVWRDQVGLCCRRYDKFGLSQENALFRSKWRRKVKEAVVHIHLEKWLLNCVCVCVCACVACRHSVPGANDQLVVLYELPRLVWLSVLLLAL